MIELNPGLLYFYPFIDSISVFLLFLARQNTQSSYLVIIIISIIIITLAMQYFQSQEKNIK